VKDRCSEVFWKESSILPSNLAWLMATFGESEDFTRSLCLVYEDILDFHHRAYKIF
jgi:hypothetical protein